jgi:hypothetical protein
MARPSEVQSELDELRNRGIAKLLNKHFTDTTAKLAKEKAEKSMLLWLIWSNDGPIHLNLYRRRVEP